MKNAIKFFACLMLTAAFATALKMWYMAFYVGGYWTRGPILWVALGFCAPAILAYFFIFLIRSTIKFNPQDFMKNFTWLLLLIFAGLQSCDYAQSNVQTLVTDDCGVSWQLIKAGQSIPKGVGMCHYKITIPDYPMQGEVKFKATFKGRVLADIGVDYDYVITDGRLFVQEAKYLGKSNVDSEDKSNAAAAFETAENAVIDKRIKEVARTLVGSEDIVDFSQSDFEDKLLKEVNQMLAARGVNINFLSFVPQPSEQTSQAIDVATAWKIYQSKQLEEVGKAVISARAGATKVTVENKTQPVTQE